MSELIAVKDDWAKLLSYLPGSFRELAAAKKQLEVQYGNAKITTADELLRFIFVHAGAGLPLRQTVTLVAEGGGPGISHVTLHQKMRRAARPAPRGRTCGCTRRFACRT